MDDEPDIIRTLALCWEDEPDMDIRFARRGDEALALMAEQVPDLVLTDFRMPQMDGVELIQRVKQDQPQVVAFMMSAFPDPALKLRAERAGCQRFIAKPFDPFDLLVEIRDLRPT